MLWSWKWSFYVRRTRCTCRWEDESDELGGVLDCDRVTLPGAKEINGDALVYAAGAYCNGVSS